MTMKLLRPRGALLVGIMAFGLATIAGSAVSNAATDVQAAQAARDYTPALGDRTIRARSVGVDPGPRLSPTPAAELDALKALGGSARSSAGSDVTAADEGTAESRARAVFRNCATNIPTGSAPPDIHGAATPTRLAVVTNRDIGIYNRTTCAVISRESLAQFFSKNGGFTIAAGESLFDPRVLYDRGRGRCVVFVESRNSTNTDQFLYVASSTTSSCSTWRRIRYVLSRGTTQKFCKTNISDFYDYPNVGLNTRRLVVTANMFPAAGGAYGSIMSIDKLALYAGTSPVRARCFIRANDFNLTPPVVGDGNTSMFILSPGSGGGNTIKRFRLNTAGATTTSDTLSVTPTILIPAWTAPPDAVQPNGQKIDSLDGRFQSASKQIGTLIWNVHAVNVGGFSRARMYKLSTTGITPLFTRTPTTSTCPNRDHLFNPSIDTNSTATTALAYVTASRTCPSLTTGRAAHLAFRGPNSSNTGWVFSTIATSATNFATDGTVACNSNSRGSCRWGDYSSTQIDPLNTTRAWSFNQLVAGSTMFDWATRGALVGP